jgi:diketogulonate reductase-like aldo/keto reductase
MEIAGRYGLTPAQIALYWLIHKPKVIASPMSTKREHLEGNLGDLQ